MISQIVQTTTEAKRLQEGIETLDDLKITESIKTLIRQKAYISVHFLTYLQVCEVHFHYFPEQNNQFNIENLMVPAVCQFSHKLCIKCVSIYVKNCSIGYILQNKYECPGCLINNCADSLLFSLNYLKESLIAILGKETV